MGFGSIVIAEQKGQVYADKWAALVQLRWVLEAASIIQETTEYMVQLIVIWSGSIDYSGIYWALRGDGLLTL